MGIDLDFGFFVNDDTFVPTKAQLLGIAALFEEAGVIDSIERENLEQSINATYPEDNELISVFDIDEESEGDESKRNKRQKKYSAEEALFCFPYKLNGPKSLPFFNMHGFLKVQSLRIFRHAQSMQPMDDDKYTRFVIAEVEAPFGGGGDEELAELENERDQNPILVFLRSRIEVLLGAVVRIETCWH